MDKPASAVRRNHGPPVAAAPGALDIAVPLRPLVLPPLPPRPRVSVAITCYNYGRFVGDCIESCLLQTRPPDEIVVVDDGSTDDSAAVIDAWAGRDARVRALHGANGGICAATAAAIAACTGDVVLLLDADDLMLPRRVECVVDALRRPVDGCLPGWVHHPMRRLVADGRVLGQTPYYPGNQAPQGWLAAATLRGASCPVLALSSSLALRRELLAAIQLDTDRLMYQDLQLCTAAALLGACAWIEEPLTLYRVHGGSATTGSMVSAAQLAQARRRADRFDGWVRAQLDRIGPGLGQHWRALDDQPGYLWLCVLERWLAGEPKDVRRLWRVLRHPDTRGGPRQYRLYYWSGLLLPRALFVRMSALVFGSGAVKQAIRRLLRRP